MNKIHYHFRDLKCFGINELYYYLKYRIKHRFSDRVKMLQYKDLYYRKLSDAEMAKEIKILYKRTMGKELNLDNPVSFNEKIQWLKVYDNKSIKCVLADKYRVRKWISEKIGESHLIPLIGAYDSFDEINFDELPDQFCIKANHGSGMNYVVKDKSKIEYKKLKEMCSLWLKCPYYAHLLELQYKKMPRKLLIEKYIEEIDGDLKDYKVHCFNGEPRIIQIIGERDLTNHSAKEAFVDIDWNRIDTMYNTYKQYESLPEKPNNYEEMLSISKTLSKGFKYVRVDLYSIRDNWVFGEMTFTPFSGYGKWNNEQNNIIVGSYLNLNKE